MIANTKIKYTLALEDPDKTLDVFKKVAGQSITVETGSYEGSVNNFTATSYRQNLSGSIQRRDRIELQELKALKEMEGVLIFKDQVTRARSFTWFHSIKKTKLPFRLNRFLQVDRPKREDLTEKLKPIDQTDARFTTIDRIMKKIRLGRVPTYIGTIDPVVDAVADTYHSIETHNPNETAINRGIAYYMAAVEAMRKHKADEAGRYWEPIEVDPSTLDDAPPIEVQGEDDAPIAMPGARGARDAGPASGKNPVYHDPPLREKAKEGESFEDLVRQFTEAPSASRTDAASYVPSDYDAPAHAVSEPASVPIAHKSPEPAADPMAGKPAADDDLDAFLRRFQSSDSDGTMPVTVTESATPSMDAEPEAPSGATDSEHGSHIDVTADLDNALTAALAERTSKEVVIGFTEKTAETLVKIEEALGSESPVESMKTTEAEISAQLKWTKPVDEMSDSDLDNMFSSIEATINRSANRVK